MTCMSVLTLHYDLSLGFGFTVLQTLIPLGVSGFWTAFLLCIDVGVRIDLCIFDLYFMVNFNCFCC